MTADQEIRAKALDIAQRMFPADGIQDLTEHAESLAGWIAIGELDKPWSGTPDSMRY